MRNTAAKFSSDTFHIFPLSFLSYFLDCVRCPGESEQLHLTCGGDKLHSQDTCFLFMFYSPPLLLSSSSSTTRVLTRPLSLPCLLSLTSSLPPLLSPSHTSPGLTPTPPTSGVFAYLCLDTSLRALLTVNLCVFLSISSLFLSLFSLPVSFSLVLCSFYLSHGVGLSSS